MANMFILTNYCVSLFRQMNRPYGRNKDMLLLLDSARKLCMVHGVFKRMTMTKQWFCMSLSYEFPAIGSFQIPFPFVFFLSVIYTFMIGNAGACCGSFTGSLRELYSLSGI